MINGGKVKPDYPYAAHHIVAFEAEKATPARNILKKFGIDINHSKNGVFLPTKKGVREAAYHRSIHTNNYYDTINELLSQATTKQEALEILDDIATQLLKGGLD